MLKNNRGWLILTTPVFLYIRAFSIQIFHTIYEYDKQIQQVIKKQNELKQLAKDMSTKNAAVRRELKDNHCHEELIKEMQVLKEKLIKEYNGYEHKELSDPFQIFD